MCPQSLMNASNSLCQFCSSPLRDNAQGVNASLVLFHIKIVGRWGKLFLSSNSIAETDFQRIGLLSDYAFYGL